MTTPRLIIILCCYFVSMPCYAECPSTILQRLVAVVLKGDACAMLLLSIDGATKASTFVVPASLKSCPSPEDWRLLDAALNNVQLGYHNSSKTLIINTMKEDTRQNVARCLECIFKADCVVCDPKQLIALDDFGTELLGLKRTPPAPEELAADFFKYSMEGIAVRLELERSAGHSEALMVPASGISWFRAVPASLTVSTRGTMEDDRRLAWLEHRLAAYGLKDLKPTMRHLIPWARVLKGCIQPFIKESRHLDIAKRLWSFYAKKFPDDSEAEDDSEADDDPEAVDIDRVMAVIKDVRKLPIKIKKKFELLFRGVESNFCITCRKKISEGEGDFCSSRCAKERCKKCQGPLTSFTKVTYPPSNRDAMFAEHRKCRERIQQLTVVKAVRSGDVDTNLRKLATAVTDCPCGGIKSWRMEFVCEVWRVETHRDRRTLEGCKDCRLAAWKIEYYKDWFRQDFREQKNVSTILAAAVAEEAKLKVAFQRPPPSVAALKCEACARSRSRSRSPFTKWNDDQMQHSWEFRTRFVTNWVVPEAFSQI